jgi:hypothetical protein
MRRRSSSSLAWGTWTVKGRTAAVVVSRGATGVSFPVAVWASLGAASRTRPKAPAAATVARTVRQVGEDETVDIIMLLRGRPRVAVPEWVTSGVVPEPGVLGDDTCTSGRPSPWREAPSWPRVGRALTVSCTGSRVIVGSFSLGSATGSTTPRT